MKSKHLIYTFLLLFVFFPSNSSAAIDPVNTRLLTNPAISASKIAFVYAEDVWTANRDGSNPKRITIDHGVESNPVFSPDGRFIALMRNTMAIRMSLSFRPKVEYPNG